MLHIIHQTCGLKNCLAASSSEDILLFIEEGVFCLVQNSELSQLKALALQGKIFALAAHAIQRRVSSRLIEHIQYIDYDQFVDLTIENTVILKW